MGVLVPLSWDFVSFEHTKDGVSGLYGIVLFLVLRGASIWTLFCFHGVRLSFG